jgi:hypothetical protein
MSDPFFALDQFDDDPGLTDSQQVAQARWEATVVKTIASHGVDPDSATYIRRRLEFPAGTSGRQPISFDGFVSRRRDFRLWIESVKLPHVHRMTLEDLFNPRKRAKLAILKAYRTAELGRCERYPCVGLAFEWLHSGGRIKLLHDDLAANASPGLRLSFPDDGRILHLENLEDYLVSIGWVGGE